MNEISFHELGNDTELDKKKSINIIRKIESIDSVANIMKRKERNQGQISPRYRDEKFFEADVVPRASTLSRKPNEEKCKVIVIDETLKVTKEFSNKKTIKQGLLERSGSKVDRNGIKVHEYEIESWNEDSMIL